MATTDSSTYSEDEFELSLSPVSSIFQAVAQDDDTAEEELDAKSTTSSHNDDAGGALEADHSSVGSSFESDKSEAQPDALPPCVIGERDGRTAKQKYLDLKRKVQTMWEEAEALAQRRYANDVQAKLEVQQTKEAWRTRIHRRHTEIEMHRKVAAKTAQSIVDTAQNRAAWAKGVSCARARASALEEACTSTFASLQARKREQEQAAKDSERKRAAEKAAACSTVWDAARYGVPVQRLRELMERRMEKTRHIDPSEPFEQLCRRAEGVVVESRHPYPKGIRQDVEACVPGAECFYVAFDAASDATMGAGRVSLQEPSAKDAVVYFPRGPYCDKLSGAGRLPGVGGEPPMRVEGSSVVVTFSASYWRGTAAAGKDYGWRLVCFTADGEGTAGDAPALVAEAEKAADRAQAVDTANNVGETCLHVACFSGNVEAVKYLLSLDADPNSAHTAGGWNTPLHEAVRGGSLASALLLLKSSANVLAANSHGDLPLHVACREGRVDIARRLLSHDPDWSTAVANNHAGLRPSEVVHGCSALIALLGQVESAAAASTERVSGGGGLSRKISSDQRRNINKTGIAGARSGGGGSRSRRASRKLVGGRGAAGGRRSSRESGMLLSTGVLPRWARLPRPLDRRAFLEDEAQSTAGWSGSGTSYGVSLAESDFAITRETQGRQ